MENTSITQHKIYVENSKFGEKSRRCQNITREKYSLCGKLLQPYYFFIFFFFLNKGWTKLKQVFICLPCYLQNSNSSVSCYKFDVIANPTSCYKFDVFTNPTMGWSFIHLKSDHAVKGIKGRVDQSNRRVEEIREEKGRRRAAAANEQRDTALSLL